MESSRDDNLAATLSALRPAPRPAFAAELDERAAAGFPRRESSPGPGLSGVISRLGRLSPRHALVPVGAAALAAFVAAFVIVAANGSGGHNSAKQVAVSPPHSSGAAGTETSLKPFSKKSRNYLQAQQDLPNVEVVPGTEVSSSAASAQGADSAASSAESEGGFFDGSGSYIQRTAALKANHRDIERSAEMVLGADPTEVGDDAAKVFAAVHAARGIVLNSSVHDGSGESAPGASFELLIPSAKLGDALASFSQIAEVRYRREATADITAPTVGVSERLQDSNAKVEGLLAQLAAAETDGEREAVEVELETERRHAASLRSQLSALQRRADLSRVSLRIKTGKDSAPSHSGGGWSIGDAFHDAGQILAVGAGIAIVALAILGPLALIALVIWLANRAWVHRGRQRALG